MSPRSRIPLTLFVTPETVVRAQGSQVRRRPATSANEVETIETLERPQWEEAESLGSKLPPCRQRRPHIVRRHFHEEHVRYAAVLGILRSP